MDKVTPKSSDVFQANSERAAPLLAKLRAEGIGHMIGGKTVPSTSGQTFETKSPVDGAVLATEARDGLNTPSEEHWNISTRVPIGPVGVITPWNTPFMLSTWKIAPALAAGCTVVHKPAEWSPVTADLLAKLAKQAGVPDGVLN